MQKFKELFSIFAILCIIFSAAPELSQSREPGVLVVRLKSTGSAEALHAYGTKVEYLFDREYRLTVLDVPGAVQRLRSDPGVEFAEPDLAVKVAANANDPLFVLDENELKKQWYLPKMQVPKAWEKTVGNFQITVAVVDTGIDSKHEDLNDGRVSSGYMSYCQTPSAVKATDCLVHSSGELAAGVNSDDNGHGTIVAGIIGAIPNNNKGISGIDWNVTIMPIKALDSKGSGVSSDVAVGIHWAVDHGARIINLSVGGQGLEGSQALQEAVSYAFNKGVLVIAAAGNDSSAEGSNINVNPVYPVCADGGKNMVVGVAAVDINDRKAGFSNFGSNCVDIAAPGTGTFISKDNKQGLVSTYFDPTQPGEQSLYVYALGTSVAAPMVSGTAALMMSIFPNLDVRAIRDRLLAATDNIDDFNGTGCGVVSCVGQIGRGRLNVLKAVTDISALGSGSLVQSSDGNYFLIEQDLKRPVSQFVYNQRKSEWQVTAAAANQLDSYPIGLPVPPIDGTLVKESADQTVYLVEGGELRPLTYLAFMSRSLKFENVVTLQAAEIASYTKGSLAPAVNGALVKAADNPAVYILNNGTRQLLSYFVFMQRGLNIRPIAILSEADLAQYPLGSPMLLYPPIDGTLIKGDQDPTVYLVMNGSLHAMTFSAFQNRSFNFGDVKIVPQSEIFGYALGAIIEF